jgi:homoserine kinase
LSYEKVKLKVPATIANLVCGFDILGMAIHEPFDVMELKLLKPLKSSSDTQTISDCRKKLQKMLPEKFC